MRSGLKAWLAGGAALLLVGALAGLGLYPRGREEPRTGEPDPPADRFWFRDVTAEAGIDFTYRNGEEAGHYAILESLGGGVALIDYDGDDLLDVFVTGGGSFEGPDRKQIAGRPCRLYKNLGGWRFRDATAEAGLDAVGGRPWFYTHGCAVGDYDRDGRPDLLVTGYGRLALFRNEGGGPSGGRRFKEVTKEAGLLGDHFWGTSAAFADLDGDGFADLYVCQYVDWSFDNNPRCPGYSHDVERDVCPPTQFEARPHALYRNNGDGTFAEVGREAGLHAERRDEDYARLDHLAPQALERLRLTDRDRDFGKGLGVVIVDVEGDGRPDVYIANDTTDKFLYLNRSSPGRLRLDDVAVAALAARDDRGAPNGSMGVDAADYDGRGLPSLLVTNYQNELPALYRNGSSKDGLRFVFSTTQEGLGGVDRRYVGFGTAFLDADNDGWEDVVMVNGHVIRHPKTSTVRQEPVLFQNRGPQGGAGRQHFADVSPRGGPYFATAHQARGLAIGDLDNDGRPDLVVSHVNEPVTVLRNEAGDGQHWLGVRLLGRAHGDVVGAKVTLEVGGRTLTRFVKGGGSYLSSGDRRLVFGLGGSDKLGRLTVAWPWGQVEHWDGLQLDRYWQLPAGGKATPAGP